MLYQEWFKQIQAGVTLGKGPVAAHTFPSHKQQDGHLGLGVLQPWAVVSPPSTQTRHKAELAGWRIGFLFRIILLESGCCSEMSGVALGAAHG